jgi:hypothetical protein
MKNKRAGESLDSAGPRTQSDLSPVLVSKLVLETHGVPPEQLEMT